MKKYTAIIVDDEVTNIFLLKKVIANYCINIDIIGESLSFDDAIHQIETKDPDIIYLDVMLKEGHAFEMIDKLQLKRAQIVFVTSDPKFAVKAFQYNATDFILKPLNKLDVIMATNKAISNLEMQKKYHKQEFITPEDKIPQIRNYLAIPSVDKIDFIKISDIMFFNAEGKYTTVYTVDGTKYLTSKNIGDYERNIDQDTFYRIHYSYIVNMNYVTKINKKDGAYCELSNGLHIPIAKRRQDNFNKFIKIK
jgi:two-component system LytT family response regulator